MHDDREHMTPYSATLLSAKLTQLSYEISELRKQVAEIKGFAFRLPSLWEMFILICASQFSLFAILEIFFKISAR